MESSRSGKRSTTIPPPQFHCVWMSAGILMYQLCDREFDCDHCPLDAAMRKHFGQVGASKTRKSRGMKDPVASRCSFTPNHCWLCRTDETTVRIGIEPGLAKILASPKAVVFPRVGDDLTRGRTCLWVVLDGGTLAVASPISGTAKAVNTHINEAPHELCVHPLTKGWLIDVQSSLEQWRQARAVKSEEIESRYARDAQRFDALVATTLQAGKHEVGRTMQDGGRTLSDVLSMLGPKQYFDLLRSVYGGGFQT